MPAYSIQFRRGTAVDHSAFTGELAEITIDITNNRVVLHDGETAGGIPLAKVTDLPIDVGDLTDVNGHIAAAVAAMAPATWYGDRAIMFGGETSSLFATTDIDYYSISNSVASSDFGNLNVNIRESCAVSDSTRAVSMGWPALNPSPAYIEYISVATLGGATATSFSMTGNTNYGASSCSNGTYGYTMGGQRTNRDIIDYITIQSLSNATSHGNLTVERMYTAGANDETYGVCIGGRAQSGVSTGTIDYFTMSTSGNASNFGNEITPRNWPSGCGDATRGVWAGGRHQSSSPYYNNIEYITFQTPGSGTNFGSLTRTAYGTAAASDHTYASWSGGYNGNIQNTIDYITIQTGGTASNFGSLTSSKYGISGCSGSSS